jgi:hypothetical protein
MLFRVSKTFNGQWLGSRSLFVVGANASIVNIFIIYANWINNIVHVPPRKRCKVVDIIILALCQGFEIVGHEFKCIDIINLSKADLIIETDSKADFFHSSIIIISY